MLSWIFIWILGRYRLKSNRVKWEIQNNYGLFCFNCFPSREFIITLWLTKDAGKFLFVVAKNGTRRVSLKWWMTHETKEKRNDKLFVTRREDDMPLISLCHKFTFLVMKQCLSHNPCHMVLSDEKNKTWKSLVMFSLFFPFHSYLEIPANLTDYLRFSGCYKNVSKSEDKCATWVRKIQEMDVDIQENIKRDKIDEGLHKFCWWDKQILLLSCFDPLSYILDSFHTSSCDLDPGTHILFLILFKSVLKRKKQVALTQYSKRGRGRKRGSRRQEKSRESSSVLSSVPLLSSHHFSSFLFRQNLTRVLSCLVSF